MNRRPQPLGELLPAVLADLARRHGVEPPTTLTDRTPTMPDQPTEPRWHMDPALHAHCVERAAELAEHFLANRLGVTFTDGAPTWLAERQAEAEGRTR